VDVMVSNRQTGVGGGVGEGQPGRRTKRKSRNSSQKMSRKTPRDRNGWAGPWDLKTKTRHKNGGKKRPRRGKAKGGYTDPRPTASVKKGGHLTQQ